MEKTLIAKTQGGLEITCKVLIDEAGNIETEYPIVSAENAKMGLCGYSIELTKKQFEKMFDRKCPVSKANVMLKNGEEWPALEAQAEKIKNTRVWGEMLKKNEKLNLWKAFNSGGATIIDLPEALKNKKALLLEILDFNWDAKQSEFLLTITAKELLAAIEKGEAEEKAATAPKKQMTAAEERELISCKLFDAENAEERQYLGLDDLDGLGY